MDLFQKSEETNQGKGKCGFQEGGDTTGGTVKGILGPLAKRSSESAGLGGTQYRPERKGRRALERSLQEKHKHKIDLFMLIILRRVACFQKVWK